MLCNQWICFIFCTSSSLNHHTKRLNPISWCGSAKLNRFGGFSPTMQNQCKLWECLRQADIALLLLFPGEAAHIASDNNTSANIAILYNLNGCRVSFFSVSSADRPDELHFMWNDNTLPWTYLIPFVLSFTPCAAEWKADLVVFALCPQRRAQVSICQHSGRPKNSSDFFPEPVTSPRPNTATCKANRSLSLSSKHETKVNIMHPGACGDTER